MRAISVTSLSYHLDIRHFHALASVGIGRDSLRAPSPVDRSIGDCGQACGTFLRHEDGPFKVDLATTQDTEVRDGALL
jgi:hypothetical protein